MMTIIILMVSNMQLHAQNFDAIRGFNGCVVMINVKTSDSLIYNQMLAKERTTPCSTFKIWNTLIGCESGLIQSKDSLFYIWDGVKRDYEGWNQNLTIAEAFKYSCVPAYQNLARKIGVRRMNKWIRKIGYGDCNTKSGIDIFWLPRKGKTSILISPMEQALLIKKLVNGKLGFSAESKSLLKKIALSLVTNNGRMYGKTGSGENVGKENNNIGWFVGLVESNRGSFAFACLIKGKRASGKIAKQIMTQVLMDNQYI